MIQGIYEQPLNKKLHEAIQELETKKYKITKEKIDKEEAHIILSKYVGEVVRKALEYIRDGKQKDYKKEANVQYQIQLCNRIIKLLEENLEDQIFEEFKLVDTSELLLAIQSKINTSTFINEKEDLIRPVTSIASSSLFTGSKSEPDLVSELRKEIASCDRIDMLISFIRWTGLRLIYDELKEFVSKEGHKVRIITTCYMGATDAEAIEKLAMLGNVEVKISYDTKRTRLHAKSYLFHRDTGFSTAYIGSSNMSKAAMTSGLEWNMKITEKESFDVIKKFSATYESYWNSYDFEFYNPSNENSKSKLITALRGEKYSIQDNEKMAAIFDIQPYAYQKAILDELQAERVLFGHYKNLLVAATGIGKTIIAAFDFKAFLKQNPNARLLFIAHREEILTQSIYKFRGVLKDANFGESLYGGMIPEKIDHLFASIQSFSSKKITSGTSKDFYDFIIVDEFHHAAADSYKQLLDYYEPKILLGLTATPERMDGKNIVEYFEDRIASEMRLPEAIDHKLLVPFHYFCVSDPIDLSGLKWQGNRYQVTELENLYNLHHEKRVRIILDSMKRYLSSIEKMKAIGFCASIKHAEAMEKSFNDVGIKAISVTANTPKETRVNAKKWLEAGEVKIIFTRDVYNEGVDIPCINTVLFLRPTESLTVFLQQLGRGLRHDESSDKECLTVLDYVGQAHENYDYEVRFRALKHRSNLSVRDCIIEDLMPLPRGCHIKMEKQAKTYILDNIKKAIVDKPYIIRRMKSYRDETHREFRLSEFLDYYNMDLQAFYGKKCDRSFYTLSNIVLGKEEDVSYKNAIMKRYKNFFYIDSRVVLSKWIEFFNGTSDELDEKEAAILYYSLYNKVPYKNGFKDILQGLEQIRSDERYCDELLDILGYRYKQIKYVGKKQAFNIDTPLEVHCSYTRNQLLAGLGYYNDKKSLSSEREFCI